VSVVPSRFDGQGALIVGGASGLGRVTAARIVAEGGRVGIWDSNAAALDAARRETGAAHAVAVDIADHEAVAAAGEASHDALGRVDVLVISAGITGATSNVWEYPIESWRRVIEVDLNGPFYCCRSIVPYMLRRNYGRIVNISSVAGKEGNPNAAAYSAAKAGLIGFTKSLGKELAKTGVRVNCVTPATFNTPILAQLPQSQIDYMISRIPIGRPGEPEEVAALVCWLASAECSFSTGAVFDASGGRTTY
jgi:3-oxoacyl-[acyl-carrier protein] reductase